VDPDASVDITPASVDLIPARSPPSPPAGNTSGDVHLTNCEDVDLRGCDVISGAVDLDAYGNELDYDDGIDDAQQDDQ
jgi:hypothetical protein